MLETYKELISNQFEASLCMLGACVDRCPESAWHAPVANLKFCQVAFHVLCFADAYLGHDFESQRHQPFHRNNATVFADYEEIGGGLQQAVYEKSFIKSYLKHCCGKASSVIAAETAETLERCPGFETKKFSRAELHVYNIRHIPM